MSDDKKPITKPDAKLPDAKPATDAPAIPAVKVEVPPVVAAEAPPVKAEPAEAKEDVAPPETPEKPAQTPQAGTLFEEETATYHAWVTEAGDAYQGNLSVNSGTSTYTYPADSPEQAERILKDNIRNMKL